VGGHTDIWITEIKLTAANCKCWVSGAT